MTKATKASDDLLSAFSQTTGDITGLSSPLPRFEGSRTEQSEILVSQGERPQVGVITARGKRFAINQIGSIFGSE